MQIHCQQIVNNKQYKKGFLSPLPFSVSVSQLSILFYTQFLDFCFVCLNFLH